MIKQKMVLKEKKLFFKELGIKVEKEEEKIEDNVKPWSEEELSQLAKAINRFPGGTHNRWQHVAEFVGTRSVKEIIAKTKEAKYVPNKVQNLAQVQDAYERFNKNKKPTPVAVESAPTIRDVGEIPTRPEDWNGADQKLLEKALATFPATLKDRWDKIAGAIPGKTKKECIERYKYLVDQIKQKRAQQ
eukprot:TRINITY_DN1832_c0_g1_i1.p1 TRINITY_DN1832_c0_g1~~TRINITY_DN1832_c0_g1_i1.p1  ORF type:complete len:188 (-),score=57.06 TRINITY_DN1832_c0_g1_i1:4-567(-)